MDISVIIPAHNEEKVIADTLGSIKKQSCQNYETIIVCDSCRDRTAEVAQDFGGRIVTITKRNIRAARNAGAELAQSDILVFHDADTIMDKNYLEEIHHVVLRGYTHGSAFLKPETTNLFMQLRLYYLNSLSQTANRFYGCSFSTKKMFFEVGGYNEKLIVGEDKDLATRMKRCGRYKFLEKTYLVYSERRFKENGYAKEFLRRVRINFST